MRTHARGLAITAFTPGEEHPDADAVIILSDALWRRRFSRDPFVLVRTVNLDGRSHEIVGVMPPSFAFPDVSIEFWVPFVILTFIVPRPPNTGADRQRSFAESFVERLRAHLPSSNIRPSPLSAAW